MDSKSSNEPFQPPQSGLGSPVAEHVEMNIAEPQHDNAVNSTRPKHKPLLSIASGLLIAAVVFTIAGFVSYSQYFMPRSMESSSSELLAPNLTAKMFVGFTPTESDAMQQIEQFATGPLELRYCHAILVNEVSGAAAANEQLKKIDKAVDQEVAARTERNEEQVFPTESQQTVRRVLGKLFNQYELEDFDSASIAEKDQQLLEDKLGWIANLALTPKESPNEAKRKEIKSEGTRVIVIVMIAAFVGILAILGSILASFLLIVLFASKKFRFQFQDKTNHGFVYLETFAIWILFFFGLQIGFDLIAREMGRDDLGLVLSPIAFFGSLLVLIWPMMRGIPFSALRRDIGWELRNPFAELFVGGFSYLALLIPMIFGMIISVAIGAGLALLVGTGDFESTGPVGHPIAEEIANGGPMVWILVIVSACVAAPIVEETMFRGVLYRYLRDATSVNKARWISVAVSSLVGGLIFAMIHPQGLIGIPILTTLAIGFSLVREWRNSLIAPMFMHAINNSIVTCMLLTMMS